MRETRIVNFHTGRRQAQAQLLLQAVGDLLDVGAQRDAGVGRVVILHVVVGVDARHVSQCGLGLHGHIGDVVVHVKESLGGVGHAPHHNRSNLDGVALLVVDLDALAVVRARAERHLGRDARRLDRKGALLAALLGDLPVRTGLAHLTAVEGVCPIEARLADGANVVAKEKADLGLARLEGDKPGAQDKAQRKQEEANEHHGAGVRRLRQPRVIRRGEKHDGPHQAHAACRKDKHGDNEHCPTRLSLDEFLGRHLYPFPLRPPSYVPGRLVSM